MNKGLILSVCLMLSGVVSATSSIDGSYSDRNCINFENVQDQIENDEQLIKVKSRKDVPVQGIFVYQKVDGQKRDLTELFSLKNSFVDESGRITLAYEQGGLIGEPLDPNEEVVICLIYPDNTNTKIVFDVNSGEIR